MGWRVPGGRTDSWCQAEACFITIPQIRGADVQSVHWTQLLLEPLTRQPYLLKHISFFRKRN